MQLVEFQWTFPSSLHKRRCCSCIIISMFLLPHCKSENRTFFCFALCILSKNICSKFIKFFAFRKWWCHFDDDVYVNINALMSYLSQFDSDEEYIFAGQVTRKFKISVGAEVVRFLCYDFNCSRHLKPI